MGSTRFISSAATLLVALGMLLSASVARGQECPVSVSEPPSSADCPAGTNLIVCNVTPGCSCSFGCNGTEGDDCMIGNSSANFFQGLGGNDFIIVGGGNDFVFGGDGEDQIFGGTGGDSLYGQNDNDLICGGAGTDTLSGDFGADSLYGGSEADAISGGDGNDTIYGNDGNDVPLQGGAGVDEIYGGAGDDQLLGGDDGDALYGESGADEIHGGAGGDFISAGSEDDSPVTGGDGNDTIFGDGGSDAIYGDRGDDVLYGGAGADLVNGGGSGGDRIDGDLVVNSSSADSCKDDNYVSFTNCESFDNIASVLSFDARLDDGRVVLTWETSSELGTLGFRVLRRTRREGSGPHAANSAQNRDFVSLGKMLPATGAASGGRYRLVDSLAKPGESAVYRLVEIEQNGEERVHDDYDVIAWLPLSEPLSLAQQFDAKPRMLQSVHRKTSVAQSEEVAQFGDWRRRGLRQHEDALTASASPSPASVAGTSAGNDRRAHRGEVPEAVRLGVNRAGMHVVSAETLAKALGRPLQDIESRIGRGDLTVHDADQEISWASVNEGLAFHIAPTKMSWNGRSVTVALGTGRQMKRGVVEGAHGESRSASSYLAHVTVEEDTFFAVAQAPRDYDDLWFWKTLASTSEAAASQSFEINLEGLALEGSTPSNATAQLEVELQGATLQQHQFLVNVNGTSVGDLTTWGQAAQMVVANFSSSLLRDGSNSIELRASASPEEPADVVYINSLRLSYPRTFRAIDNALEFEVDAAEPVRITNFRGGAPYVFDLEHVGAPRRIEGAEIVKVGDEWEVAFTPSSRAPYLAVAPAGLVRVAEAMALFPKRTRDESLCADYVAVRPAHLSAPLGELLEHRRAQGLRVLEVDLQDVYDGFSAGALDPSALQRFVRYAKAKWKCTPSMLLLVGDGSVDSRNGFATEDQQIPPMLHRSAGMTGAADTLIGMSEKGDRLDLAIGRLPVTNANELRSVIDKIIVFESLSTEEREGGDLVFASDRAEKQEHHSYAGSNRRLSEHVAPQIHNQVVDLSVDTLGLEGAHEALLEHLESNTRLLHYTGHGGMAQLGKTSIFSTEDVPKLAAPHRLPVVTASACLINRFDVPGGESLGEALVLEPDKGAVAVWAPSGLSREAASQLLAEATLPYLDGMSHARLGLALMAGANTYLANDGSPQEVVTTQLLGDPALLLRGEGEIGLGSVPGSLDSHDEASDAESGGCGSCSVHGAPTHDAWLWLIVATLFVRRRRIRH